MCIRDSHEGVYLSEVAEYMKLSIPETSKTVSYTHLDRADAGRTRPERPDYPGTESAARRIADLEREVKQREPVSYTHLFL